MIILQKSRNKYENKSIMVCFYYCIKSVNVLLKYFKDDIMNLRNNNKENIKIDMMIILLLY